MVTPATKISSNVTSLYYCVEDSIKTVSGDEVWKPLEPNTYDDFGGETTLIAREPINANRQLKKGVITDLDASGGFSTDVTLENLQDLGQGFFFAALRKKDELAVTDTDTTLDDYQPASGGDGYVAKDLLFAKGFDDSANNGLKEVTGTPSATSVEVAGELVTATTQTGTISRVGFEFGSAEVDIDVSGTLPKLSRVGGTKDMTDFGLIPGEYVFIGGDTAPMKFVGANNNGFCRVRSVATTYIEFDKTDATMTNETGTALTIRIFFGRVLKNETGGSIVRTSYQLERQLGAEDTAIPANIQSEYLTGAIPNELTITAATASKLEASMQFVGLDHELRTGVQGIKAGTRQALVESNAFNTSSDISKIKLATVVAGSANPSALFAYATDLTITVNNNVTPDKALGVLGGFEASHGNFTVGGELEAYFADTASVSAVRNNADITLEVHYVKANAGISLDMPLLALGDGRLNVTKDEAIKIPLSKQAASGAAVHSTLNHTLLMVFWDYLPTLADT